MRCEHAMDTPEEYLVYDAKGTVVCPKCLRRCGCCFRRFFFEDLDDNGLCAECAEAEEEEHARCGVPLMLKRKIA